MLKQLSNSKNTKKVEQDAIGDSPTERSNRGNYILKLFKVLSSMGFKLILCRGKVPILRGHSKSDGLTPEEAEKIVENYKNGFCPIPTKTGKSFLVPWKILEEVYDPNKAKTGFNCLNIGILTWASHIYGMDIDRKREGKDGNIGWMKIIDGIPVKDFFLIHTGSGGFHAYYREEGNFDGILFNQSIPGIDLLCKDNGGSRYILSPGSVHPNGGAYYMDDDSLSEVPSMSNQMNEQLRKVIGEYQKAKETTKVDETKKTTTPKGSFSSMTKEQMRDLLMNGLSSERSDDRNQWLRVIWAIKSINPEYIDLAREFSQRSRKYDEKDFKVQWKSGDVNRANAVTWGTAMYYCKEDNQDFYQKWCISLTPGISIEDPFSWFDFIQLFSGKILTVEEENQRILNARRVMACIGDRKGTYYVVKDEGVFIRQTPMEIKRSLNSFQYQVKTITYGKNNEEKVKIIDKRLFQQVEKHNYLFSYAFAKFYPRSPLEPYTLGRDVLNMYGGFKAKLLETYDEKIIAPLLNHFLKVWCKGNREAFKYLIGLKAHQIQYPRNKVPVHTVLYSLAHGVGKNIIAEWEIEFVYGKSLAVKVDKMAQILGQFNSLCEHMLMVLLDEVGARKEADWDFIKSFTSTQGIIEAKGVDARYYSNYATLVFFSNHDSPVKLEAGDRRYFVLEASDIYAKDKTYWKELQAILTSETADHWYTYLMNVDLSDWDYHDIPMTEARKSLLDNSRSIVHVWIDEEDWAEPMRAKDLKEKFVLFCQRGGYDGYNMDLGKFAKKMGEHPKMGRFVKKGNQPHYYHTDYWEIPEK